MFNTGDINQNDNNLLGAINEDDFLAALNIAPEKEKKKLFRKLQAQSRSYAVSSSSRSRAEFEKRIHLLPVEIQRGLADQSLQAVDTAFYAVKPIGGSKSVKMFRDDDSKIPGYANISSGKLEKGNFFLLYGVCLMAGVADDTETFGTVNFNVIPGYLRNGEFEFKANGTILLPNNSAEAFYTEGKRTFRGMYTLDNPKFIKDQQPIEFNVEWASTAPDRTYLKAVLLGTAIIKA
jgi:hypothetical protein